MKYQFLLLLTILFLSCSSSEDENSMITSPITANESLLTNNIWKKIYYENIRYEDANSTSTIYSSNAGTETLKFNINGNVTYVNPDYTQSAITGAWNFTENEHVLNTNLKRENSAS